MSRGQKRDCSSVAITFEGSGVVATCSCGWERYDPTPTAAAGRAMWEAHRPKPPPEPRSFGP